MSAPAHAGEPNGARGRIRTHDLLVRSQALYPAELRGQLGPSLSRADHRSKRCRCYTVGMGLKDEEDIIGPTASRQEYFSRSDKGRREALRREIRDKKGKDLKDEESLLKAKVNLKQLKNSVTDKKDAAQNPAAKEKEEAGHEQNGTFGTKTHKQEERQEVEDAQVRPSPERLIKKEERKEERQEQAAQEYQQNVS